MWRCRILAAIGILLLGEQVLPAQTEASRQQSQPNDLSQRACLAEIPQNHIMDNIYTNDSVGFTYTFPTGWKVKPIDFDSHFVGGAACITTLTVENPRKGRYGPPDWTIDIATYNPAYQNLPGRKPWDPADPNTDDAGFKPAGKSVSFTVGGQAFVGQVYCGIRIEWCLLGAQSTRAGYMLTVGLRAPKDKRGMKAIQEFISGKGDLASGFNFVNSSGAP